MNRYEFIGKIGEGAFESVYKAKDKLNNEIVAIKILHSNDPQKFSSWQDIVNFREVKALQQLHHKNIIKLKEIVNGRSLINNELFLIFQYVQLNILQKFLNNGIPNPFKKVEESIIKKVIYQIVEGLAFIHQKGFFHRDIKPENILVTNDNCVKIADSGLSKKIVLNFPMSEYISTRWYRAPQLIIRMKTYGTQVDIFALGCLMGQLYNGTPLFPGQNDMEQLFLYLLKLGRPSQKIWPQFYVQVSKLGLNTQQMFENLSNLQQSRNILQNLINRVDKIDPLAEDLLRRLLQPIPRKRITAKQILCHPYFQQLTFPKIYYSRISLKRQQSLTIFQKKHSSMVKNSSLKQASNSIRRLGRYEISVPYILDSTQQRNVDFLGMKRIFSIDILKQNKRTQVKQINTPLKFSKKHSLMNSITKLKQVQKRKSLIQKINKIHHIPSMNYSKQKPVAHSLGHFSQFLDDTLIEKTNEGMKINQKYIYTSNSNTNFCQQKSKSLKIITQHQRLQFKKLNKIRSKENCIKFRRNTLLMHHRQQ